MVLGKGKINEDREFNKLWTLVKKNGLQKSENPKPTTNMLTAAHPNRLTAKVI